MHDVDDVEWLELQASTLTHRALVCETEAQLAADGRNRTVTKYLRERAAELNAEAASCRTHAEALRRTQATQQDQLPF